MGVSHQIHIHSIPAIQHVSLWAVWNIQVENRLKPILAIDFCISLSSLNHMLHIYHDLYIHKTNNAINQYAPDSLNKPASFWLFSVPTPEGRSLWLFPGDPCRRTSWRVSDVCVSEVKSKSGHSLPCVELTAEGQRERGENWKWNSSEGKTCEIFSSVI